jgi:PAS domain S-box-containing protein
VLTYVIFSALWIYYSDKALGKLTSDPAQLRLWATCKGWAFVAVTGSLLAYLLRGAFARNDQAQLALAQSEARFRQLVDASPDAILIVADGKLVFANPAAAMVFGARSCEEVVGKSLFDLIHSDDHASMREQSAQVLRGKAAGPALVRKLLKIGGTPFYGETAVSLCEHQGQPALQAVVRNVTARERAEAELRRTNRALQTISQCDQTLVHARDEAELLREICRVIVETRGYRMAWVGFAEHDEVRTVRPAAQSGFEEGYLESAQITWADTERGRGPTGTAIRTGQPTFVHHIPSDPHYEPWRAEAMRRG